MQVALKSLIGSHNYNLANKNSDRDYKVFYIPTFDDLYSGKINSKSIKENGNNIEYHDIRRLPEFLKKANINFVEVLFSQEMQCLHLLHEIIYELREDLARMNLPYLYKSSIGTATSRYKDYKKLKEKGDINKANKQLANAIRMLDFICHYGSIDCLSFGSTIYYEKDDEIREILLRIKNGEIDGEPYYEKFLKDAETWRYFYLEQEFDEYTYKVFEEEIKSLVKSFINDDMNIKK